MENKEIKLFVVSHKELNSDYYPDRTIIYVGPNQDKFYKNNGHDYKDNLNENMANKNYTYCECTAMYNIFKNINCEYVGIEHYRRLFGFIKPYKKEFFLKKLKKYEFVVMHEWILNISNKNRLIKFHNESSYKILEETVHKLHPDYDDAFNKVMNNHHAAWCNMMVTSKKEYDEYCKFLFDILFDIEKNIEIPKDPYQARIMGFLAERLLSVYLLKNKKKIYHSFILFTKRYTKK